MSKFIVELKEVYTVKYTAEAPSKEHIIDLYNDMLFAKKVKLEAMSEPIEYVGDDTSSPDGTAIHRILTLEEYNKECEQEHKVNEDIIPVQEGHSAEDDYNEVDDTIAIEQQRDIDHETDDMFE